MPLLSPKYNKEVIEFLIENINRLPTPYIYELSRRLYFDDKQAAYNWLYLGRLMARYDAMRCSDKTAGQGIQFWVGYNEKLLLDMQALDDKSINKIYYSFLNKADDMNWENQPHGSVFMV